MQALVEISGKQFIAEKDMTLKVPTQSVSEGDKILKGDRVLVIEAMKMETTISAEKSGTIKKIYLKSGDNVETKDLLIEID